MSLYKSLRAAIELNTLRKDEDPEAYKKLASTGFILAHPVKIKGHDKRNDNGIDYHSTIKFFDKENDDTDKAHELASKLDHQHIDPKKVGIEPKVLKDRNGNDVYALGLTGDHADKIKEHHDKFSHMGHPEKYKWGAHISVPKSVHDEIKAAGHKNAHDAGIEFGHPVLKRGPKTIQTYTPKVQKAEALLKPWSSQAQAAWGHSPEGKEALGGEAAVKEWDAATKGKHLPKHVKKSEPLDKAAPRSPGPGHTIKQLESLKQDNWRNPDTGTELQPEESEAHLMRLRQNKADKALPGRLKPAKTSVSKENPSDWFGKSKELEKGSLKDILTAGMMAGALASPHMAGAPTKSPEFSRDKISRAIASVESSGGKNTAHKVLSNGQQAYGKFALMPDVIHDTIRLNPDLKGQHRKALNLQGENLHHYMQDNPQLENEIVNRHMDRLQHHFGNDPTKIAFAWNQGIKGTNRAVNQKQDLSTHPYVQKFKQAYESEK